MPASDAAVEALSRRLLETRIVVLGGAIDDTTANLVCSQLLILQADDPVADITLYINSPGGSVDAGFAIYDTMRFLGCEVATVAMGLAASMGQFLLCAGTPGKRYALRHSRILMHQPLGQVQGLATDLLVHAGQFAYLRRLMAERLAEHTGQSVERITADFDRDRWFTAEQALEYGMVDELLEHRSQLPATPVRRRVEAAAPAVPLQPVILPPPPPPSAPVW
jgi:ATP-dependent Clp protease, protease subunit